MTINRGRRALGGASRLRARDPDERHRAASRLELFFDLISVIAIATITLAFLSGYGHLFIFGAIAILGAGIAAEIDLAAHKSHATQAYVAWRAGGPLAMFLLAPWFVRDRVLPMPAFRRMASPGLAAISLAAAAAGLSSAAFAVIMALGVVWRAPMKQRGDTP